MHAWLALVQALQQ